MIALTCSQDGLVNNDMISDCDITTVGSHLYIITDHDLIDIVSHA